MAERQQVDGSSVAGPSSKPSGPSSSSSSPSQPKALAPLQSVPRTKFILVEYPGIVKPDRVPQRNDNFEEEEGEAGAAEPRAIPSRPSNLDIALSTLAPEPPPYGNAGSALDHLGRAISLKSRVIECRPWAADHYSRQQRVQPKSVSPAHGEAEAEADEGPSSRQIDVGHAERAGKGAQLDLFKRPLVGEIVETHDFVAVVHRRIWRKKKKGKGKGRDDDEQPEERREYTIDPLGTVDMTVRWRKMADFSYQPEEMDKDQLIDVPRLLRQQGIDPIAGVLADQPDATTPGSGDVDMVSAAEQSHASPANMDIDDDASMPAAAGSSAPAPPRGGVLSLYDALARMDIASMRSLAIPTEKEDFEIEDDSGNVKSNLRLPPPPIFTRIDEPFPYSFRQSMSSIMESYTKRLPDGSTQEAHRWANQAKWKGLAPFIWRLDQRLPVPTDPPEEVSKHKDRCDERLLRKLTHVFDERPVWTKSALLNQFESEDDRKEIENQKEYIPLVAYAIAEGVWAPTYVRLGYDLRDDINSRFYQKLAFQFPTDAPAKGRGKYRGAYGGAHASSSGATTARKAQMREEAGTEAGTVVGGETNDHSSTAAAGNGRQNFATVGAEESTALNSHYFDGKRVPTTSATFLLCDIIDEKAKPLIDAVGPENLLEQPTDRTGWYTALAWERIKAVVGVRFRKLVYEKRPATDEEVQEALNKVQQTAENRAKSSAPDQHLSGELDVDAGGSAGAGSASPPRGSTSMSPPSTRGGRRGSTVTAGSSRARSGSAAGSSPERATAGSGSGRRGSASGSPSRGTTGERKKSGRPRGSKTKKKAGDGAGSPTAGGSGSDG